MHMHIAYNLIMYIIVNKTNAIPTIIIYAGKLVRIFCSGINTTPKTHESLSIYIRKHDLIESLIASITMSPPIHVAYRRGPACFHSPEY